MSAAPCLHCTLRAAIQAHQREVARISGGQPPMEAREIAASLGVVLGEIAVKAPDGGSLAVILEAMNVAFPMVGIAAIVSMPPGRDADDAPSKGLH